MESRASNIPDSPAVKCFAECPHFEGVSGRCTHDQVQVLRKHFVDNPKIVCPIYDDWRAEQMQQLANWLATE